MLRTACEKGQNISINTRQDKTLPDECHKTTGEGTSENSFTHICRLIDEIDYENENIDTVTLAYIEAMMEAII